MSNIQRPMLNVEVKQETVDGLEIRDTKSEIRLRRTSPKQI